MVLLYTLLILAVLITLTVLFPAVMLIVFLALAALILFVLLLRPIIDIRIGEELAVTLKVLFLRIPLIPKKDKPIKLSDFRIAKFRKRRLKEQRKYLLKKYRKEADKKRKEEQKAAMADKEATEEKAKRSLKENVAYALDLLKLVILRAVKKFGKHLRIDLYYLYVTVGGKEPDRTAQNYGKIAQSVSYLTELLDRHLNVRYPGRADPRIWVGADFLSEKSKLEAHLAFHISVWQVVSVGLTALFGYLKMPKHEPKAKPQEKATTEPKDPDATSVDLRGHKVH